MQYKKVSIVIPVYNERSTINSVLDEVRRANVLGLEKEIVLVDDSSTDGTSDILKKINEPAIKVIYHEQNQGKGAALHTGFKAATGDITIIQDADLEYDPADIEKVLKPFFDQNAAIVYGSRYLVKDSKLSFWHSWFNQLFTGFANILIGQKITDIMTCYKAFNREVMDKVNPSLESKRFGFEPEITAKISKAGYKIMEVAVSYRPRSKKEGKHMNLRGQVESLWALLKYSIL